MMDTTVTVLTRTPQQPASASDVMVGKRYGKSWIDGEHRMWSWPERADRWVEIRSARALSTEQVLGYAKGLVEQPLPMARPYTFALVPLGFVADNIGPAAMTFRPPGVAPGHDFGSKITVMLSSARDRPEHGSLHDVQGRQARLVATADGTGAWVEVPNGALVTIFFPGTLGVSEYDAARFTAGIQPTPLARISSG